jgi:hypothetical protein
LPVELSDGDELGVALTQIGRVLGPGLTGWIRQLEASFGGATGPGAEAVLRATEVDDRLLAAALRVKRTAGQVNVLIHAVGILIALPKILEPGETVQSLSLGAGNTGRAHDLETNRQIAEFTFIDWRGGSESIRQNKLFADVVALDMAVTDKRRVVYINGAAVPVRFLQNHRALDSVLKDAPLERRFRQRYGNAYPTVADYWSSVKTRIEIVDLAPLLPALA